MAVFEIPMGNKKGTKIIIKDKNNADYTYDPTIIIDIPDAPGGKPAGTAEWASIPDRIPSDLPIRWINNFAITPAGNVRPSYKLFISEVPEGPNPKGSGGIARRFFIYNNTVKEITPVTPSDRKGMLMFELSVDDPPVGIYP